MTVESIEIAGREYALDRPVVIAGNTESAAEMLAMAARGALAGGYGMQCITPPQDEAELGQSLAAPALHRGLYGRGNCSMRRLVAEIRWRARRSPEEYETEPTVIVPLRADVWLLPDLLMLLGSAHTQRIHVAFVCVDSRSLGAVRRANPEHHLIACHPVGM